ncbi:hypothetical protein [Cylindrospermopsis raciborskii]|uniref:hypothetical protein n=1 Tax=Cylindrospermopsis raciborskii TaxID=77022 RepID=UPI000C1B95B2|nr:hypothetical protein [Cylindrospermopsis raciborskii]MCZ2207691.1 hypothetical protein [Cylindrospermopsis raciborskii PAMP2011]
MNLIPAYLGSPPARDNDGMPDAWEIARGLNPNLSNHNGYNLSSRGYTNLEVYLHELSTKILGVGGIWGRGRNEPTAIAGYMGTSFAIANP